MNSEYINYIENIFPEILEFRRHIHQYPELSFQEKKTSDFIFNYLYDLNLKPVYIENTYSIVCEVNTNNNYPNLLFRADIDALPIEEKSGLSFSSKNNGIMHACGHDVHTAVLIGVAKVISNFRNILKCNITLLFQTGEEVNPGGAKTFIDSDFFKSKKYDAAFALHLSPELETGKIGIHKGAFMASSDEIYIDVKGRGGHAAIPANIINPITIASKIFIEIDKLNSLKMEFPFVVSLGSFIAEGATNIVPDYVNIKGTVRAFSKNDRATLHNKINEAVESISKANGGEAIFKINQGYPVLVNDEKMCVIVHNAASKIISEESIIEIPERLTSDDFAYIAEQVPSCYFRLGCNSNTKLHSSTFNPDENCMLIGMNIFCEILMTKIL
ncbi:MAG: amidohydrolase [Bacteroidales bacterium]|jgi:amidohydrolase|nr:amidohydrolase [Bacteroidales bacterium]